MNMKNKGTRYIAESGTIVFGGKPRVLSYASAAGPKENEGPYANRFDYIAEDSSLGETSWEKSESALQKHAFQLAMNKAALSPQDISFVFAGDLLNQCVGSTYGLRDCGVAHIGLFAACATIAEGLALGGVFMDGGLGENAAVVTGSHFCSAERQFRMPVNYGGQRTPTSQWTATAAGAVILTSRADVGSGPEIRAATFGKITDMGIHDANNMGAAMAGAAYETIRSHMKGLGAKPDDYDLILTGDLGKVGSDMLVELFSRDGDNIAGRHGDCGKLLYDIDAQDAHAGGSGAGCSAAVLTTDILGRMCDGGDLKRVLFAATGALMSPTVVQQGESIPGIAHCVELTAINN